LFGLIDDITQGINIVAVTVFSRQDRSTSRSTDGIGTKSVVEPNALVTDMINAGRLVHLATAATDGRD
jgi:hypothetical protein